MPRSDLAPPYPGMVLFAMVYFGYSESLQAALLTGIESILQLTP